MMVEDRYRSNEVEKDLKIVRIFPDSCSRMSS